MIAGPVQLALPLEAAPVKVREHGLRAAHPRPLVSLGKRQGRAYSSFRTSPQKAWRFPEVEYGRAGSSIAALVFDCDDPLRWRPGLSDLPPPNWIVRRPVNDHAHVAWCLDTPVHRYPAARPEPLRFLSNIAEYYQHALAADAGYAGVLAHNPSPLYRQDEYCTTWGSKQPYIRVVRNSVLVGAAITSRPSYHESTVEARARSGRTMRATIPTGTDVQCECMGADCRYAHILQEAMDEMWSNAFEEGTRQIVTAYLENYSGPLASTSRATLRGRVRGAGFEGQQPVVEIDIPDSAVGRDLIAAWDSSGLVVRPFIADVEGPVVNGVRTITKGRLRAFMVTSTDARDGWPEPEIVATPDELATAGAPRIRRWHAWL